MDYLPVTSAHCLCTWGTADNDLWQVEERGGHPAHQVGEGGGGEGHPTHQVGEEEDTPHTSWEEDTPHTRQEEDTPLARWGEDTPLTR